MRKRSQPEKADLAVAKAAAPVRGNPLVRTLGTLSEIADQPQLITACALTLAAGLATRDRRLARAGARMLAAELVATAFKSAIKHQVDRTRPRVVAGGGAYKLKKGHSHESGENSFPSGHTAGAVAVARALAREFPEDRSPAYAAATAVALIQIPRCQHYPTDLAAGALVGLIAEAAVDAAFDFGEQLASDKTPRRPASQSGAGAA